MEGNCASRDGESVFQRDLGRRCGELVLGDTEGLGVEATLDDDWRLFIPSRDAQFVAGCDGGVGNIDTK